MSDNIQSEDERSIENNANVINNAADVAIATKNPYAMAAGGAVKAADKLTGGKASKKMGEIVNNSNKINPLGKRMQKSFNNLSESGAADKIGTSARLANAANGKKTDIPEGLKNKNVPQSGLKNKDKNKIDDDESLELNEKDEESSKNKDNNSKDSKSSKSSSTKDSIIDNLTPIGKWKKKLFKIKVIAIVGIILFSTIFFFAAMYSIYGTIIDAISSFFGISDHETSDNMTPENSDSLIFQEDYNVNPETGEGYTIDELVTNLSNDTNCSKVTGFSKFFDWFYWLDGKTTDTCKYIRYIESKESSLENKYSGLKLDRGLIISSIFFGYTYQPNYSEMKDASNTEILPSTRYLETLVDALSSGKLKKDDLDKIIDNSYSVTTHHYYTWTVENETNKKGVVIASVGKCVKSDEIVSAKFDIVKWNTFMRFGEDAANTYVNELIKQLMYTESSEECTGKISDDDLLSMVQSAGNSTPKLDSSVKFAQNELSKIEIADLSPFSQSAQREGDDLDVFIPYSNGDVYVEFNYQNGFIYNKFPSFKQSIEDSNINIEYNDITTPKIAEDARSYIIEKKTYMNEVLHLEDMDEGYSYLNNANVETSVVLGAYCGNYLTAPIDSIRVTINSCDGQFLVQTSLKEYITGVAYREVSDKDDDYVKTEMVAALSYALHRRGNSTKGTVITMRSGNCDQAYCPMSQGCHSQTAALDCGGGRKCTSYIPGRGTGQNTPAASSALISKYNAFYEEIKDFLLISGDTIYSVSYRDTLQNEWYSKASSGMSYTQIIQESYPSATLIRCSTTNDGTTTNQSSNTSTNTTSMYGNGIVEGKYTEISPDLGKYYGFSYSRNTTNNSIEINPEWVKHNIVTINSNCKEGNWEEDYEVNVQAKENFEQAFKNICKMLTKGVEIGDGSTCKYTKSNFSGGKAYVAKETLSGVVSDLSYGIAQNWNYDKEYTINGKKYTPYDSTRNLENYLEFVSALGKEEDCRNINYILYKYAYEPAGFLWGGDDGRNGNNGKFNAMHYRIDY